MLHFEFSGRMEIENLAHKFVIIMDSPKTQIKFIFLEGKTDRPSKTLIKFIKNLFTLIKVPFYPNFLQNANTGANLVRKSWNEIKTKLLSLKYWRNINLKHCCLHMIIAIEVSIHNTANNILKLCKNLIKFHSNWLHYKGIIEIKLFSLTYGTNIWQ